jgi:hypothetical protein
MYNPVHDAAISGHTPLQEGENRAGRKGALWVKIAWDRRATDGGGSNGMFPSMDHWDLALWAVAGYLAVVTLVRRMIGHRDRLVAQARADWKIERRRRSQLARLRRRGETKAKPRAGRDNAA